MKLLSVIVPSCNMEAYLPKCLGSMVVAPELMGKLDVLVVNDGSKDRTSEIANEFAAKWPGTFRVIDKANGHYGSCINAALPVVTGTYVKVVDADDYVLTDGFARLIALADEESAKGAAAADLLVSDVETVDADGKVRDRWTCGAAAESVKTLDDIPERVELSIQAIAYRTDLLREMGYVQMEGIPYTDKEWVIDPMSRVKGIRYLPAVVSRYLLGREGQTMECKTIAGQFDLVAKVALKIAARYRDCRASAAQSASAYYRRQVLNLIRWCYHVGIFGYGGLRANFDLDAFDRALQELSEIDGDVCEIRIARGRIAMVRNWRRHHSRHTPAFLVYRVGLATARLLRRV